MDLLSNELTLSSSFKRDVVLLSKVSKEIQRIAYRLHLRECLKRIEQLASGEYFACIFAERGLLEP